ncbi:MAG: class I SAM-dependent methyltransferase [Methanosarcinaceae archaeon]|nr:class I SAM-dependent methyltransferase [Methanosarcinaceae archaeon]
MNGKTFVNIWEKMHSQRSWGKYPNEELVKFVGRNFFKISKTHRKNIKFLEIGCGQGANLWFLVKEGFDVYGIDISYSAIEKTEQYLKGEFCLDANLNVADARKLPYVNNFFDVVVDCAAIQCTSYSDHREVYDEVYRVLKPNGYFWSFHIAKRSWGYGTGNLIDLDTFDNLSEGPLKNTGPACMPSEKDIKECYHKLKVTDIEKSILTYENQQKEIIHYIIEARKGN